MIKSGIPGFDKLIGGGLKPGKSILLSGTPGTGKTIMALQFLHEGTVKHGEKGMYVSFEENKENLISQAKQFGWDLKSLEKKGKATIWSIRSTEINKEIIKDIIRTVKKNDIKRLVIDSLSTLAFMTPTVHIKEERITEIVIRRFIYGLLNEIRELDNTVTMLVSQTTNGQLSRDTVSEFLCDGIIHIEYEPIGGDYSRHLTVRKMREADNDEDIHPMEIGRKGIRVHDLK